MNILVEPLRRLYLNKRIIEESVIELYNKGTITEEDKEYILRKE